MTGGVSILNPESPPEPGHPQALIDRVLADTVSGKKSEELARAREDFFRRTGRVYEEDPQFEGRLQLFFDWFLFDRPLDEVGATPIRVYIDRHRSDLPEEERRVLDGFLTNHHALFELLAEGGGILDLRDLTTGETFQVEERRALGVLPGDFFDARVVPFPGGMRFTGAFCFHPREARRAIRRRIRSARKEGMLDWTPLLHDLALKSLKIEKYRYVRVQDIYA